MYNELKMGTLSLMQTILSVVTLCVKIVLVSYVDSRH